MAGEIIRTIVARCYSDAVIPITQSQLDGQNVRPASAPVVSVVPAAPGQAVRDLVGRCYPDEVIRLEPNALDGAAPIPKQPIVVPDPAPAPREVIQQLVGRCYPDLAQKVLPPAEVRVPNNNTTIIDIGVIEDFLDDLIGDRVNLGPKIIINPPTPDFPSAFVTKEPKDCEKVAELAVKGKVVRISQVPSLFKHKETGEVYECDIDMVPADDRWTDCVRNTVECMMRPYMGGAWQPPAPDCEGFQINGFNANKTEVCVKNCYPERKAIYQYKKIDNKNIQLTPKNQKGIHSNTVMTTDSSGSYVGPEVYNPGGNKVYNSGGARNYTTSNSGVTVNFRVTPTNDGDWDTKWRITSWSGTLPSVGTKWTYTVNGDIANFDVELEVVDDDDTDTDYGDSMSAPSGYVLSPSEPVFYVLKDPYRKKTVPLYKYYSSSRTDTFLTINPGQPDSPGQGERQTMNNYGMQFREILGHVFQEPLDASGTHHRDELVAPLDRYWDQRKSNHYYTINPEQFKNIPIRLTDRFAYRMKPNGKSDLRVVVDCEHGNAGYNNSMGVYVADQNGPVKGWIVLSSSRRDTELESIAVPAKDVRQYKTVGYFIVPDGGDLNSYEPGTAVTFQSQSDGFRASGISSAESNYCLFSDYKWNPGDKDYTKWKGISKQFWEDLINGDDDYDDLKFWHRLGWQPKRDNYEGIACYVYEQDAPPRIMKRIEPQRCGDYRSFDEKFKDVQLQRQDCGALSQPIDGFGIDWECGKCLGEYSMKVNTEQEIKCLTAGRFRLVSYGGITGGIPADCTRFRIVLKKNGTTIYNQRWTAKQWPEISAHLSGAFNLSVGDRLGLEIPEITHGSPNGFVSPSIAILNQDTGQYVTKCSITLGTLNADNTIGEDVGLAANNPILEDANSTKGSIRDIAMQFRPRHNRIWEPGSYYTKSYNYDDDSQDYPYTMVWQNNSHVGMSDVGDTNAQHVIFNRRGFHIQYGLAPNWTNGYIDTGILHRNKTYYRNVGDINNVLARRTGNYTKLVQDQLVTEWLGACGDFGSAPENYPPVPVDLQLKSFSPTTLARGSLPYSVIFSQEESDYYNNAMNAHFAGTPYPSPTTFTHDYELKDEYSSVISPAKVRIGFTFYCPRRDTESYSTGTRQVYWQCIIRFIGFVNNGKGYQDNQEFVLSWPPKRDKKHEDKTASPYYPDYCDAGKTIPRRVTAIFEDRFQTRRSPKYAMYMHSHLKGSPIWYYASDREDYRVTFKIIVKGTN